MTWGPNSAHWLFFVKFYRSIVFLICLHIIYGCFHARIAELSSCDRDWLTYKVENTCFLALRRKMFANPWSTKYVGGAYIMTLTHEWLKFGKCQSDSTSSFVADVAETQEGKVCSRSHSWGWEFYSLVQFSQLPSLGFSHCKALPQALC